MAPRTSDQNEEIRKKTSQQLMDAAFELFASEGYSKTSISAVAKKAGVSKGLIYHYFSSKQEILVSIFKQLTEVSDEIMEQTEDVEPFEKLKLILDATFLYIKEHPGLMRLMISLALQPDAIESLKPLIDEANKNQFKSFSTVLKELGREDAETEGYYLGAKLDGVCMGYLALGDGYPLEEIKQKIMEEYVPI